MDRFAPARIGAAARSYRGSTGEAGDTRLRKVLFAGVMVVIRRAKQGSAMRPWAVLLLERTKPKIAAAVPAKVRIILTMMATGAPCRKTAGCTSPIYGNLQLAIGY